MTKQMSGVCWVYAYTGVVHLNSGFTEESSGQLLKNTDAGNPSLRDLDSCGLGCSLVIGVFKKLPRWFSGAARARNHWVKTAKCASEQLCKIKNATDTAAHFLFLSDSHKGQYHIKGSYLSLFEYGTFVVQSAYKHRWEVLFCLATSNSSWWIWLLSVKQKTLYRQEFFRVSFFLQ